MVDRTRPNASSSPLGADVNQAFAAMETAAAGGRTQPILDQFVIFAAEGFGITAVAQVSAEVAEAFVRAPTDDLQAPSVTSMHWRRTMLRSLFRAARATGTASHDPTLDLVLPPRSSVATRPLIDDEIDLARSTAQWSLDASRHVVAWALAEATCRSSELPWITGTDVDLKARTVQISGGKRTVERVGRLSDWALPHLHRRIAELDDRRERLLYRGDDPTGAGQASCSRAVVEVLTRSGLNRERDVRPASVAAWAGRKVLDETGRIDAAARTLGVRSLDQAARMLAWDWHDTGVDANR